MILIEAEKGKILSIQMLRGIAASMVCMGHFTTGSPQYLDGNILKTIGSHGPYGVQIFFVISGFILPFSLYNSSYHIRHFGNFFLRRLIRLEPPYLASIAITLILAYVSTLSPYFRGEPLEIAPVNLFLHLGYLNAFFDQGWLSPVYWTLAIEFQFYIILGLLYTFFKESKLIIQTLIIAGILALSVLIESRNLIFSHSPMFLLGVATFIFHKKKICVWIYIGLIAVIAGVSIMNHHLEGTIWGLLTLICILYLNRPIPALLFLGDISYSLYLLHVPIGMRIVNLTEALTGNVTIRLVMIVCAFGASIFCSYVFYKHVEKKSVAWAKKYARNECLK